MTIVCPHCKSNAIVVHLEFSSLKCLVCEKDVSLGDWLISIKAFSPTQDVPDLALPPGHSGSSLECQHPFCVAEREQVAASNENHNGLNVVK